MLKQLLAGEALLAGNSSSVDVPRLNLLALTPGQQAFVEAYLPKRRYNATSINQFNYALFAPGNLGLKYDASATLSAAETFAQGRGNCLSISFLVASMLRYGGFRVHFQEVMTAPSWSPTNTSDSYQITRHVNVVVKLPTSGREMTLDFNRSRETAIERIRSKRLSDAEAMAQYYNNHAVNYMFEGDVARALGYFRKALLLAPKDASIWSNVGVLYRRAQLTAEAEAAFLHAIDLDASTLSPINNLVTLYARTGQAEKAEEYRRLVQAWRDKNPYYRLQLAQRAFAEQRFIDARRHVDFVISELDGNEQALLLRQAIEQKLQRAFLDSSRQHPQQCPAC